MTGMAYGFAICSALFNGAHLFLLHKSAPFTLRVAENFLFQHTIHEALRCCQRSSLHCKQKIPSHFSVQLLLLNFLFAPKILWLVNRLLPNRGVPHKAWQGDLVHHIGWFQRILEGGIKMRSDHFYQK